MERSGSVSDWLIRIQEAQKHVDPVDPDPQHCWCLSTEIRIHNTVANRPEKTDLWGQSWGCRRWSLSAGRRCNRWCTDARPPASLPSGTFPTLMNNNTRLISTGEQKPLLRIRWHFGTDPEPRIPTSDWRIRILVFCRDLKEYQSWSPPGLLKQIEFRYFLISKIIK